MDKTLISIEITINRPDGTVEVKDISTAPGMRSINKSILDKIRIATRSAGRGEVVEVKKTFFESNMHILIKQYNDRANEGGYGYIPSEDFFKKMHEYCEKHTFEIIK